MVYRLLLTAAVTLLLGITGAQAAGTRQGRIQRGQYLARAADCAACHTVDGGTPYAGGRAIETPFGVVYGTNITPDKTYGIGNYSAGDFYHALTEGERPDGTQLYPAMPYTTYHSIPRKDSDAMYAYLMSLKPVHQSAPETDLSWPFSMRWTLNLWNLIFADWTPPKAPNASPEWKRGRYLVDVLGHCGGCHTPRNRLGAVKRDEHFKGAVFAGYLAPNLNAKSLAARGWDPKSLKTFLRNGMSAKGNMFSEMYPVFHYSTRYLDDADLKAMSLYLMGENPPKPEIVKVTQIQLESPGRQHYLNVCAGCHGARGEGVPHVAVAMQGNTTLRLADPRNLIKVVHDGIRAQQFSGFERMQAMPGFADKLSNAEIADLVNYLRRTWGGLDQTIDAKAVRRVTRQGE